MKNRILLVHSSNVVILDIIRELIANDSLQQHTEKPYCTAKYTVDNKYYTAELELNTIHSSQLSNYGDSQWSGVDAIIAVYDPANLDSLVQMKACMSDIEERCSASVLLCVQMVPSFPINSATRSQVWKDAQTWCIDNGFELVKMNSASHKSTLENFASDNILKDEDDDEDDDEEMGISRIKSALYSNMWDNMIRKDPASYTASHNVEAKEMIRSTSYNDKTPDSNSKNVLEPNSNGGDSFVNPLLEGVKQDEWGLGPESSEANTYFDDFDKAFDSIHVLKEKATKLSDSDRKALAEKVALGFWNLLGGDEEDGNDTDEEEGEESLENFEEMLRIVAKAKSKQ